VRDQGTPITGAGWVIGPRAACQRDGGLVTAFHGDGVAVTPLGNRTVLHIG